MSQEDKLRQLLLEHAHSKQPFVRAKNRTQFLALWPSIRKMLEEGWTLTAICEVLKANQWLDLHYSSLRRYVAEQKKRSAENNFNITPRKERRIEKVVPVPNQKPEVRSEETPVINDKPAYSVPPKFNGGRSDGQMSDYEFMLGKGKG